jgi:hypothetical protein
MVTKCISVYAAALLLLAWPPIVEAKSWRVATPYPGTFEKKDPLHNMPDDSQSKLQKQMARMKDVFDPKKRQNDNKNVEKAKAKLKREAQIDIKKDQVKKAIPQSSRKPLFTFPGQDREKNSLTRESTSRYNS